MIDASRSGKLAGAVLDVYPNEPVANGDYFNNELNAWRAALRAFAYDFCIRRAEYCIGNRNIIDGAKEG